MDPKPSQGSAVDLRDLRVEARALSPEDFEGRHGSAFLLLSAANLAPPGGPATTQVRLLDDIDPPGESTASLSLVAFPVRRTGRSAGHLITLGRASNNDVAIPDVSVSRFHAFLKVTAEERWHIQDAGSTNGTTVNGNHVPQQGHGAAVELKGGDNVRLGQVEFTFLGAREMHGFVLKLER